VSAIRGTFKDGQIILDGPPPADWPDGARVIVEPEPADEATEEIPQGDDPESIARWLAWYESLKEFQITDDEGAEWDRMMAERKERQKAAWDDWARRIKDQVP